MRRRAYIIFSAVFVFSVLACDSGASRMDSFPQRFLDEAKSQLPKWLGMIPPGDLDAYGFKSLAETEQAAIGQPIPAYSPEIAAISFSPSNVETKLQSGPLLWYIPVEVHGRLACIMEARVLDGDVLQIQGIGFDLLASRIRLAQSYISTHYGADAHLRAWITVSYPTVDFALARDKTGRALWLKLTGTVDGVQFLSRKALLEVMRQIGALQRESIERDGNVE